MKKGDIVQFKNPFPDELGLLYILLEDPDGERVLGEAIVDMVIRPSQVLEVSEIVLYEPDNPERLSEK